MRIMLSILVEDLRVCCRVPRKNEALPNFSDVVKCQAEAKPHHHPVGHFFVDLLSHLVQVTMVRTPREEPN